MSLLTIIQDASEIIGLESVSQVVSNSDENVRQLRGVLLQGGNMIANTTNSSGGSWSVLERIYEFQTQDGVTEYALPSDFEKLISETAWQKEKYWKMRGSVTSRQWQAIRNRQASIPYNVFRILRSQTGGHSIPAVGGAPQAWRKFTLEPAPGDDVTIVYEYVSSAWWVSQDGAEFKRRPTDDTDESLFGDHLHTLDVVWRFKSANALKFTDELAMFEMERDRMLVQDEAAEYISAGVDRRRYSNHWESDIEWGIS